MVHQSNNNNYNKFIVTLQLRNKICRDATLHGIIGTTTRELYLKYNSLRYMEKKT